MYIKYVTYIVENTKDLIIKDTGEDIEITREDEKENVFCTIEYDELEDLIEVLSEIGFNRKFGNS